MMRKKILGTLGLFLAFGLWTGLLCFADVQKIGPRDSAVGLAALNGFFHDLTGVHMGLYLITDWLGLVPVGVGLFFAGIGLSQWIKRKNILKVDRDLLLLGGLYLAMLGQASQVPLQ